ncbi:MAG: PAS domain S-box protein, partial [Candidatus Saccharimonas sp.]|nr:PAS domain S-box protein [Planctomycetaceae bacterium]
MVDSTGSFSEDFQVRNIIDTAMDGIIAMNEEQKIVLFNTAAEEIFGWRADQVLGQSIEMLIPGRFRPQHQHDVKQFGQGVIQSRRMGTQRTVLALRASGEEFPIEASISKTTANDEKIYTVIVRDVTEAVRHRQQIEQQSQMLDQVSDAVSVVDLQERITFWNQAASRLYGWAGDEVLGRNAHEVLYRGDPEVLSTMLREANARRSWSGELTKVSRSGKTVIVEHRRTVLQDESGAAKGYLCIDIDITDRKKQERAAHRSQRLESIGTLAGGIAHDLNNVLTPILMGAQLLASGRTPANRQGLLDTMVASAQRGADLIQQLLSFAGGIRGERSPVRMDRLVAETRALLEHTLPKSVLIETQLDADCPPVLGDATELSQILMNLSINARDAMPDGGTLTIEATSTLLNGNASQLHPEARPGWYVLLKVSDTGTGMSSEVLDRIFDPFFTTKEIGKGTGLGLATVQGIVKSHGGFVNVYSEPRCGSKFSIYLPAAVTAEATTSTPPQASDDSGRGRTVLLVDDEGFILQVTTAALEGAGYRVLTARDGSAAIATFSQHRHEVSAVLLDMMMPGLDGLQTLDQLRQIDSQITVIACSGLRTSQRETEVLKRGAKAFLPKPYSEDQLL